MSTEPSVWQVLFENDSLPDPAVVTLEEHSGMADVREQLRQVTAAGFAEGVRDSLADSLKALLNIPLGDVIGAAWGKARELLEYRDKTKHPPEEIAIVPLSQRTIESTHKPYVDILINGTPKGRIDFEVRIALTIESATVKIQNGRIWEIRTGKCKAEGSLKCGPALLAEKKLRPIALPGTVKFAEGLTIA
jgi:hypothetical protein